MSSNIDTKKNSEPIPIPVGTQYRHTRTRSASVSSSSSGSASSPSELPTPLSGPQGNPAISPGSSPLLSYFLAQSPAKSPTGNSTFPFRKFGNTVSSPVFEEDENQPELPATAHARRASTVVAGRFGQTPTIPDVSSDRGAGLLRRLSLSGGVFSKSPTSPPAVPPNSAVSPVDHTQPFPPREVRSRRANTLSVDSKPRRAPSPMGERMLKGHFDGFN